MQHSNATFSPALTENEASFMQHMSMFGSDGYPVRKLGRKWEFQRAFGVGGTPVLYKTKKDAFKAVEAFMDILRDKIAGRLKPSAGSPAAQLPEGWSEATYCGMAACRDPQNGGIVDREIVSGDSFAISNRPGVGPFTGFSSRPAAFEALFTAHQKV